MIQLATDPNASRTGWRHHGPAGPAGTSPASRLRASQGWPFLSKAVLRPQLQESLPKTRPESGT